MSLDGKVAIVTGSGRGLGLAYAQELARQGAAVVVNDVDAATADQAVASIEAGGGRAVAVVAPVGTTETAKQLVQTAVDTYGRLDILVANAGIGNGGQTLDKTSETDWTAMIDVNLGGVWKTVKAGVPHILEGGRGGSIILIGSAAGIRMQSFMIHYTASKHAVVGMARGFAAELGRHNIRVNSLNPGAVATPMGTGRMREAMQSAADTNPQLRDMHKPLLPQGIAQPEDISDAVAWLASDQSRFVTGTQISVDIGIGYC